MDLDYSILIAITAAFGGLGIVVGHYAHSAFYTQSAVIFGMFAFLVIRNVRTHSINATK